MNNLDKNKYEVFPIYIDKQGNWFEYEGNKPIENIIKYLKNMDVIFPVSIPAEAVIILNIEATGKVDLKAQLEVLKSSSSILRTLFL